MFWRESPTLYWYGARDAMHREVAAYLRSRARPGDVADAEEVGTVAYYSDVAMIDHAGLVTPFALAAPARGRGADGDAEHCRALSSLPRLRFVVMNRFEVDAHRCLLDGAPLAHFERAATHDFERPPLWGKWAIWVADRAGVAGGRKCAYTIRAGVTPEPLAPPDPTRAPSPGTPPALPPSVTHFGLSCIALAVVLLAMYALGSRRFRCRTR